MSRKSRWYWAVAVALVGTGLFFPACSRRSGGDVSPGTPASEGEGQRQVFAVEGMSCEGCVSAVTAAVKDVPGVEDVQVSLESGQAVVVGGPGKVSAEAVIAAVEKAGYKASPAP
jgi:copper chaperone